MGFGQMTNYNNKDMNLMFKWIVGDEKSEWHSKSFLDADKIDMGNPSNNS